MRDPELVSRAQRAAARLEGAWERWRTRHGLGGVLCQPVASYVGYAPEEPRGRPRVVFGVDAVEAERLALLLDADALSGVEARSGVEAVPPASRAPSLSCSWCGPAATRKKAGPRLRRHRAAPACP